jgi:hypothetical protein
MRYVDSVIVAQIKHFVQTILYISWKQKSIDNDKYSNIIRFLDSNVDSDQEDLDE